MMTPGFAKSRQELFWLPYPEPDRVIINAHNFTPATKGFGDELLILRGATGVTDQSESGNNCSYIGSAFAETQDGSLAFRFAGGSSGDAIDTPFDNLLSNYFDRPFTIACWAKTNVATTTRQIICADFDAAGSAVSALLELSGYEGVTSGFSGDALTNQTSFPAKTATITTQTWVLIGVEGYGGNHRCWLNGSAGTAVATAELSASNSNCRFRIGLAGGLATSNGWNGWIDDFRLLDRQLTSQEWADWAAAGRGYNA